MKTKRILSSVLALVLVLSTVFSVNVFAAEPPTVYTYPSISSNKYIEFKAQENINVYKDTACKTRGTSNPSKKYNASIAKNDVCYIYKITESYIEVNYPTSSERRTGYIKRSSLFDKTAPVNYISSAKTSVTVYKADGSSSIAKGDKVWQVDPKKGYEGYRAVIYEAKKGNRAYKMGYIKLNDLGKIENKGITLNPTSLTVAKGKTSTITATLANTGSNSISAKSSNTSIATVSVSGKKVTVKGVKNGTATISVTSGKYTEKATVSVYAGNSKYISKLNGMIDGTLYDEVYKVGTKYEGPRYSEQCKGFARTVHSKLFGYDIGSTQSKPNNYKINISTKNTKLVGSVTAKSENSDFKKLFSKGRAGDFVQMRRSHTGSHSAILYSVNSDGVVFYEANTDGANGIVKESYTWSQLNEKNEAMSLYTAKNY